MKLQTIIQELLDSGYTQKTIADEMTARGVQTNQSTIHRIATNPRYQPKSDKVFALLNLYQELSPSDTAA